MQTQTITHSSSRPSYLRPVTATAARPAAAAGDEFLKTVPIFQGLPDSILRTVASSLRTVGFRRGARIFTEGQQPAAFYIVRRGWVRTVRETLTGYGVLFEILRPGETVGAAAFTDGGNHLVTAIAGSQTELLAMPASTFQTLLTQSPELQKNFLAELGRRMRSTSEWQLQSGLGVDGRIARMLLRQAEWHGEVSPQGITVPKTFTCQELADMVGCAVETGIRMLSSWRNSGFITSGRNQFVIHDLEKLAAIAGAEVSPNLKGRLTQSARGGRPQLHKACA